MLKFNRPAQSFSFQSHFVTDQKLMTLLHRWSLACLNVKTSFKICWLLDTSLSWPFLIFWSNNFLPVVCKSFPCNVAEIHHLTQVTKTGACVSFTEWMLVIPGFCHTWFYIHSKLEVYKENWNHLVFSIWYRLCFHLSRDCSLAHHPKPPQLQSASQQGTAIPI